MLPSRQVFAGRRAYPGTMKWWGATVGFGDRGGEYGGESGPAGDDPHDLLTIADWVLAVITEKNASIGLRGKLLQKSCTLVFLLIL